MENETDYCRRSLSWVVNHILINLNACERLDRSTNKGQEAYRLFDKDSDLSFKPVQFPTHEELEKERIRLQTLLNKPHLKPIYDEFLQKSSKKIEWYSLFGGPKYLRDLADYMKRGAYYELLYRKWSTIVHGEDLNLFIGGKEEEKLIVKRLRQNNQICEIANYASFFLLQATLRILQKLRPGESLASWYKREVKLLYDNLKNNIIS